MARIGAKRIKRFTVSTRVIAGSKRTSIKTVIPGLRRIKPKTYKPSVTVLPSGNENG